MTEFANASRVYLDNPAETVDDVLSFLAAKAVEQGISDDESGVFAALRAREAEGTTGMTAGFAIPHAKSAAIKNAAVLVVKFAQDVAWESMDGEPIKVAISLLVPDNEAGTTFLRLLSQVAMLLMSEDFRNQILGTDDKAVIAELINSGLEI